MRRKNGENGKFSDFKSKFANLFGKIDRLIEMAFPIVKPSRY